MKVVLLSDTHAANLVNVPLGDVLIHCGDFSPGRGTEQDLIRFNQWLGSLPHKLKIVSPGNHDIFVEQSPAIARQLLTNATLLIDEPFEYEGKTFYFSPYTPSFGHGWAFNRSRGEDIKYHWDKIPTGLDLLVTHGPPAGTLDKVNRMYGQEQSPHAGCWDLRDRVLEVAPRFHAFGHIHESYGQETKGSTTYINCAIVDLYHRPTNLPIVIEI